MCTSYDVLQSSYQSANAMTSTLCDYGEDMGQGIRKLYAEGYITGWIDGAIVISVLGIVGFTVKSITRKVGNRKLKSKQEIDKSI